MRTIVGKIMARSGNGKTGPIPVLSRDQWSCPTTCAFFGNGCYGENRGANPRTLFQIAADSEGVLSEADLTREMSRKPARTFKGRALRRTLPIVRDREVGDILDRDGNVDRDYLETVADAAEAADKRVFGYTHVKEVTAADVPSNYVLNASCETPEGVREAWDRGLPAVMVGEANDIAPRMPDARVIACPAETGDVTCAECGLCAMPRRMEQPKAVPVIVFSPHGRQAKKARAAVAAANA